MRVEGVAIAGAASRLAPPRLVADAVATGEYDAGEAARGAFETICVGDEDPVTMAAAAARTALARAGVAPTDVRGLLHASMGFSGLAFWPAASAVHLAALGPEGRHAPAWEVGQMSNGGLAAVSLAVPIVAQQGGAVLVTTGDRFGGPSFDRWRADVAGIVYGDGGAALVLARHGFAQIRSISTVTDSRLEGLYRGDDPLTRTPGRPVDVRGRRTAFRRDHEGVTEWIKAGFAGTVAAALDENGLAVGDVASWVFPAIGRAGMQAGYLDPFGIDVERTNWPTARRTGHVGAGDQIIGLEALVVERRVGAGDAVALVGIGAGFTWTVLILEIGTVPDWPAQA